jgi:hypothetical protein
MKPWMRLAVAGLALGWLAGCATAPSRDGGAQSPEEARQVRAVLHRWLEASGGRDALRHLVSLDERMTLSNAEGGAELELRYLRMSSGPYRFELQSPAFGQIVEAFDGRTPWRKNDQLGFGLMPLNELLVTIRENDLRAPLSVEAFYPSRRLLADRTIAGRRCHVLRMTPPGGLPETWSFDAETGHLLRREQQVWLPDGPVRATEFSDFRTVGAVTLPFVVVRREIGGVTTSRVTRAEVNPSVDWSLLAPPPEALAEARKIDGVFTRYEASLGKVKAIASLRSRVTEAASEVPATGVKTHIRLSQKLPNLVLSEQETPGIGRVVEGYDGTTAWVNSDLQGYRTLKGAELQRLLVNSNLFAPALLRQQCPLRKWLGERTVAGRRALVLALASLQGPAGVYAFDAENGRLLQIESTVGDGPQGYLHVTMEFSDFRTVDDMVMPFVTTMTNPAVRTITTVESVKNNVELDNAIFQPRPDD